MPELVLLGIGSAFWPALLAVVIVSLRASHPGRLMTSFLAAGLLTTVTVGLAIIYTLRRTPETSSSSGQTFGPVLQIVAGAVAVAAAFLLAKRHSRPRPKKDVDTARPGRIERMLDRGAPLAFVAGIVLTIVPGVLPFVALKDIAAMDIGVSETAAIVVGFYAIMFMFVEGPLLGYVFVPEQTARSTKRFNAWLDRNANRLGVWALGVFGVYLIARGILQLAT